MKLVPEMMRDGSDKWKNSPYGRLVYHFWKRGEGIMNNLLKKLFYFGQCFLFLLGMFLLSLGKFNLIDWAEIPKNIGIALISASLISIFNKVLLDNDGSNLSRAWGLKEIYEYRSDKDKQTNEYIIMKAERMDVMTQNSMRELRANIGDEIKQRLTNNLKIRILIPEDIDTPKHKEDVNDLLTWYKCLNKNQQVNVTIRRYNGIPQDLYFRVDNMIFIGPYHLDVYNNQKTITYEFMANSSGGKIYSKYFERIWKNSEKNEIKL